MDRTLRETRKDHLAGPSAQGERVEPVLYVVLEGERLTAGGARFALTSVREVRVGRGTERKWTVDGAGIATLEIPDSRMSRSHASLTLGDDGRWTLRDLGSTNGSFVEGARAAEVALDDESVITLGATALVFAPDASYPDRTSPIADGSTLKQRPRGLVTMLPTLEAELPRLLQVALSKLPVLLLGDSGTGKEVLARAVHGLSERPGPFVAINCGALTPTLVESQLFGHVKGAFSGALKDEPGLVRSSSGGTLFLDEIGELPPAAQATLLRVLQEREVLPVGGTRPVPVDLRVVAATLKPIDELPSFRPDLYARLAGFVHRLVPLRTRRVDLGLIVADLLPRLAGARADRLKFAPDLVTGLVMHGWPLNVRELEHVLSVALVTSKEDLLKLADVGDGMLRALRTSEPPKERESRDPGAASARPASAARSLSEEETKLRDSLVEALSRTRGNVSEIAREMGKTRMQIHRWMKRFGLAPESYR